MQENPPGTDRAYLNIAVSRTSDPQSGTTRDWYFYRHDVTDNWSFRSAALTRVTASSPWSCIINSLTWTEIETVVRASWRSLHAMVYDQAKAVCVLFGGQVPGPAQTNDTSLWNGSVWAPADSLFGPSITRAALSTTRRVNSFL